MYVRCGGDPPRSVSSGACGLMHHAQSALSGACVCSVHARKVQGATGGRLLLHELIQYGMLHGIPFLPFASATGLRPLVVMSRVLECCGAAARSALLCSSS